MLLVIEGKFKDRAYTAAQARGVLTFNTESVPVQQFQARCADHLLFSSTSGPQLTKVRALLRPSARAVAHLTLMYCCMAGRLREAFSVAHAAGTAQTAP